MSKLLSKAPCSWLMGTSHASPELFMLNEEQLSRHLGVFGGSGSGKSKFLELLGRRMLDDYRGFCFIDPHGDTVEDLLAYAGRRAEILQSDTVCKRIHYLEPTYETVFGFDPFEFRPSAAIPERMRINAYHAWLHTKADKVAEVIQRKQGQSDFQGMARLQRILRNVLIAVGTPLNAAGQHLPLSDVLVLLNTKHPRHQDVMRLVLPHLPSEIEGDFASLASYNSEEQRKKETESTINRLRSLLSPIIKAIFAPAGPTIDFRKIIMNRGIILVNLRETEFFSEDQRNAIGGLLIHEILSTVKTTAREDRTPYYLIVDEARLFIGQDMMDALDQARKFKLSICLAGQYLGQFKTEEFDMTPSIINNCGSMISFQQKHPDDLKLWKEYFGYGSLRFEKHFQVVDRPDGYDFVPMQETSEQRTETTGSSIGGSETAGGSEAVGGSKSKGFATSHTEGGSIAQQHGVHHSLGTQTGNSSTDGEARTDSLNAAVSMTRQPIMKDGRVIGYNDVANKSDSGGSASQRSNSSAVTNSASETEAHSASVTRTRNASDGTSQNWGEGSNWSEGSNWGKGSNWGEQFSQSEGKTISNKIVPLARTREEVHESGQLQDAADDQFHKFAQVQRVLPKQHAMVNVAERKESFIIKVAHVDEAFPMADKFKKIAAMKEKIYDTHPYYSTPALSPEEQDQKLNDFLASVQGVRISGSTKLEKPENSPFDR